MTQDLHWSRYTVNWCTITNLLTAKLFPQIECERTNPNLSQFQSYNIRRHSNYANSILAVVVIFISRRRTFGRYRVYPPCAALPNTCSRYTRCTPATGYGLEQECRARSGHYLQAAALTGLAKPKLTCPRDVSYLRLTDQRSSPNLKASSPPVYVPPGVCQCRTYTVEFVSGTYVRSY